MLSELNQLLKCRREREDRSATALRRARLHHTELLAAIRAMEAELEIHRQERRRRSDQLYKQTLRSRLSASQIDGLNIELDLMDERTDVFLGRIRAAVAKLKAADMAIEQAVAVYKKHRRAGERWNVLVDDVAEQHCRQQEQAEEFAVEDDIGDRQTFQTNGGL